MAERTIHLQDGVATCRSPKSLLPRRRSIARLAFGSCASVIPALVVTLLAVEAQALPGTHPDAVSTFDTRGSTVVLAYRQGVVFDGTSRLFSYNANFTATSGNFSAQFGAHYLQLKLSPEKLMMHGAAANGTALFSIPMTDRHPNGVPITALALYLGATPTAAVSGPENFMSVPLNVGVGVSVSPVGWFTLTPWVEAAPSVNLDTKISELDFTVALRENIEAADLSESNEITVLTRQDINNVLQDSVQLDFSTHVALRAGLSGVMHIGSSWDLNLYATATSFGSTFSGQFIAQAGVGMSFHWDDVVPDVLPAERRLLRESCEDVEQRYKMCPAYERSQRSTPAARSATAAPPQKGTSPAAPAPAVDAQAPLDPEADPTNSTPPAPRPVTPPRAPQRATDPTRPPPGAGGLF